ncbi:MAG: DsrE family protein [Saprospiraceae bacterium]|nr:DsrE family protein [Saprospiraceae bacterium]MDZ4750763.1 DsrE family protein [Flavobacteriales bacterium]
MKNMIVMTTLLCMTLLVNAQSNAEVVSIGEHKIVFQLTSADTNVHKAMIRQLGNLLIAAPNAKVEVVCHSQGLDILRTNHTVVYPKIKELSAQGIQFVACENTLRERKISKEEIIAESGYVKAGILEIVMKQEEGWSYIRAGQ